MLFLKPLYIVVFMKVNGQKIKDVRQKRGWSTKDLAEALEPPVTRQAIEIWERDGVGAFKTLNKIAKALDIPPEFLIDRDAAP